MASPFAVFRRNQKVMLAVVGVLLMVAFVILPSFLQYGDSTRDQNPVVVKGDFGALTRGELQSVVNMRQNVRNFLGELVVARIRTLVDEGKIDPSYASQLAEAQLQRILRGSLVEFYGQPQRDAVAMLILAERANQMGVVVSDASVMEFLHQVTGDELTRETIAGVLQQIQVDGRPVNQERLLVALRRELTASRFAGISNVSLAEAPPPAQAWEYYCKLNRLATIEAVPLHVADFVDKVRKEPTAEELQAFYERYRDRIPDPSSPEPAFKQPQLAAFEYFQADYDRFVDQAQVSDEEIKKYYDEHQKDFPVSTLPEIEDKPGADEKSEGDDKPVPEAKGQPKVGASAAPSDKPRPGRDEASPDQPPTSDSKGPAGDAQESSGDAAPDALPKDDDAAKKKSSSAHRAGGDVVSATRGRLMLTSQRESKRTPPAEKEGATPPAAADDSAKLPPKERGPRAKPPSPAANDDAAPPAAATSPAATGDAKETGAPAAPGDAKSDAGAAKPPQYEPLEKVRDDIRKELARQKARKDIEEAFEKVSAEMLQYGRDQVVYEANKEGSPPKKPDLAKLAKQYGLSKRETELASSIELRLETDLGKSYLVTEERVIPFVQLAYSSESPLFRPIRSQDQEGNAYLSWKVAGKDETVLPLAKIRGRVVKAWKTIRARELARDEAERMAEQANERKHSLETIFGKKYDVLKAGPFSWLTRGAAGFTQPNAPPVLNDVGGIPQAGNEFMKVVFGLNEGGVGVATDQPKNVAYVIRLAEYRPSLEALRLDFARSDPGTYLSVAAYDQTQMLLSWLASLEKQAGVKWVEPVENFSRRDGGA